MPFPQPSEYDDAIQNPGSAFADAELKQGVNDGPLRFGMPGPVASGNFAVVYRFRCGGKRYAVKCFTRQPPTDQAQRFSSIHNHLLSSRLNCATEFQFLPRGIRVRGTFYPILKMEWLDAPTLLDFVPRNIHDRDVFRQLSEAFLAVCGELRKNQIAHGDLQHGNLLVLAGGGLKIIDYDGMCVPGTAGLASEEDGLPHYQHPCRRGGRLSPNFDHFPSLVIWVSLYALSIDPSLWARYVRENERLLFSKDDFSNPRGSAIFRELLSYGDERLSKAVTALRDACAAQDLANVPPLTDIVSSVSVVVDSEWWREQVPPGTEVAPNEPVTQPTHGQPDWMQPDQPPPLPARFGYSIIWDCVFAYSYLVAVAVAGTGALVGAIPPVLLILGASTLGTLVCARLLTSYKESPAVKQKAQFSVKLNEASLQFSFYELRLNQWKAEQESLIEQQAQPVKEQEAQLAQLQARSRWRQSEFDAQLQNALQVLSAQRLQIDSQELHALQAVNNEARQLEASLLEASLTEQRRQDLKRQFNDANAQAARHRNEAQEIYGKRKVELAKIEARARKTADHNRSALDGRENQERRNAESRKAEALATINREIWQLQSVINPARRKVDQLRGEHNQLLKGTHRERERLQSEVSYLKTELSRFQNIRWKRYLARVFVIASE